MTDTSPTGQNDGTDSQESKPDWRRGLENRAKAGDEAVAELAALKRSNVFRDAGLDPSDKMTGYFMKGYEGELTADAIRDEAASAGINQGQSREPDAPLGYDVSEQRIADASDDAGPVTDPDLNALIKATKSEEELMALLQPRGYEFNSAT